MEVIASFIAIGLFISVTFKAIRMLRGDNESPDPDFDLLTVEEKRKAVDRTAEDLEEAEQLITDLSLCTGYAMMYVRLIWIGDDGEKHKYDLICDGINTSSVDLTEIMEREVSELRASLAYRCEKLAQVTRSRKNGGKNDRFFRRGVGILWRRDA